MTKKPDINFEIKFEVSGLEEGNTNALKHYEIQFSEPVNADWLVQTIRNAIANLIECSYCKAIYNSGSWHWCKRDYET